MDADKLAAAVEIFMGRQPFHPFTLALNNGSRLEVDHPRGLTYRNGTGVHVGPLGAPTRFEADGVTEVIGELSRPNDVANREGAAA